MTDSKSKKIIPKIAGVLIAGILIVLVVNLISGGLLGLYADYGYSYVKREAKNVTIEDERVPPMKLFLHPEDTVVTTNIIENGLWELNETHWTTKLVRPGDTYVDVGANVGYYTVLASHLVGPKGKVFAFEPDPVNFAILEKNVRINGLTNVVLEQKACSNEQGSIQLFLAGGNKGDHRIYQTEEGRTAIDVEAVKLDDYFAEYAGSIDFVKIDTQGAEGVILDGLGDVIDKNEDIVMAVEYWPSGLGLGYTYKDIQKFLRSHDLLFYDVGKGDEKELMNLTYVDEAFLDEAFTVENEQFTNIVAVKGLKEFSALKGDEADQFKISVWEKHGRTVPESVH